MADINVSVIIVTKNEEDRIAACLDALHGFDDVWVVDSNSDDATAEIARKHGAQVVDYTWDGQYPKKRQCCLDTLDLKHDRVFFVDADEIITPQLIEEIVALDWQCAGYFVKGQYVVNGEVLKYGLCNNKLALFDRRLIEFPVIDDLDTTGMGEIEGHYQPVLKDGVQAQIGQLQMPLKHHTEIDGAVWEARHLRYATWEAGMNARRSWPRDPMPWREALKQIFRTVPFRGRLAFLHSYVFKLGVLDGRLGYRFARSRLRYYRMISDANKDLARDAAKPKSVFVRS